MERKCATRAIDSVERLGGELRIIPYALVHRCTCGQSSSDRQPANKKQSFDPCAYLRFVQPVINTRSQV